MVSIVIRTSGPRRAAWYENGVGDTRDQLLDAAHDLLRERGIMGTTTREIARAAGVADGTLYNYFRTREALFLALFDRTLPMLKHVLGDLPLRVGQSDVRTNLTEVMVAALGFFREVVPMFAAVFSDPALNESYRAQMKVDGRGPHKAYVLFERYLQAEQRMGRISQGVDPTTTGQQLIASAFFQAFTERFLGAAATAAGDKQWSVAQVTAITATWEPSTERPARLLPPPVAESAREALEPFAMPSAKASPKPAPKPAAKASPKEAAKASPKPAAKASPKEAAKASPKEAAKASPKEAAKASPKPAAKASPKPAANRPRSSP